MKTPTENVQVLEPGECWRLLIEHPVKVGRVGFVSGGAPVILPVNFRVEGRTIVFRTGLGGKLDAATGGNPLAFEVDDIDALSQEGWSVLAQGSAFEVVAPAEIIRLRGLGLQPWAAGERSRYIRLRPDRLTGRRIL